MKNNKVSKKIKEIIKEIKKGIKSFNFKDMSILEILTIVLILSVILVLLSPLFSNAKDNEKKELYISNVNAYLDRAVQMYGDNNYKNSFQKSGNNYIITFNKIDNVNIDIDPYGFTYMKDQSYITFNSKTKDIIVNVKSCVNRNSINYCYEIVDVNTKELSTKSIKTSIN